MELEIAVEILKLHRELNLVDKNPGLRDAVKLGIEALKRVQQRRGYGIPADLKPLPGETSIEDPGPSDDRLQKLHKSPIGRK